MPLLYDPLGRPIEIAPGRGDLRFASFPGAVYQGPLGVDTVGGRPVSFARLFGTQPWIAAAVMRRITWAVRVPLKCYRRTSDDSSSRLGPTDHPLAKAIVDPWQVGPGPSCQAQLVASMLGPLDVHGNSLTVIDSGANDTIRFDPVDWRFQSPITGFGNRVVGWTIRQEGDAYPIGYDQSLHVAWWSALGPLGTSPLQQLGATIRIEDAAQRHQMAMLRNGARPPSAITATDGFLGLAPEERRELMDQLREDVDDIYSGPDQAGTPAVLPPGLDWKQVGHTAVEAELIDQRKITREEICAVYQIPPPMLGILDRATFNNIEVQREMAYTDSLAPPLVLIEQIINAQVVRGLLGEDDVFVEFDFAGVLRGDRLKEVEALRQAIGMGLLTPNEGRSILNEPRSKNPYADELWMPVNNLAPMSQAAEDTAAYDNATEAAATAAAAAVRAVRAPPPKEPEEAAEPAEPEEETVPTPTGG